MEYSTYTAKACYSLDKAVRRTHSAVPDGKMRRYMYITNTQQ